MLTRAAMLMFSGRATHFDPHKPKPDVQRSDDGRLLSGVWYHKRLYALKEGREETNPWRRHWIDDQGNPIPRNGFMARRLEWHKAFRDYGKTMRRDSKAISNEINSLAGVHQKL